MDPNSGFISLAPDISIKEPCWELQQWKGRPSLPPGHCFRPTWNWCRRGALGLGRGAEEVPSSESSLGNEPFPGLKQGLHLTLRLEIQWLLRWWASRNPPQNPPYLADYSPENFWWLGFPYSPWISKIVSRYIGLWFDFIVTKMQMMTQF